MKTVEFGPRDKPAILMLHGGGLSWWDRRGAALRLMQDHRVILPILDGHAGSDRPFTSIEDNAQEILDFIERELGGRVSLIAGLSLGGQILLEMLARREGVCRTALVESASVLPSRCTAALAGPAVSLSYPLIQSRRFAFLQFRALHLPPELFGEYFRDTCAISKESLITFTRASALYSLRASIRKTAARVHVVYGGRETARVRASAEAIRRAIPGCTVSRQPGLRHGEFSICQTENYVRTLRRLMKEG